MASVFGNNIKLSIFGQSHSEAIGMSFDGLPCGFKIDMDELQLFLSRRAPGRSELTSKRSEKDVPEFVSGLFDGKTCGAPLAALIYNEDVRSAGYEDVRILQGRHTPILLLKESSEDIRIIKAAVIFREGLRLLFA